MINFMVEISDRQGSSVRRFLTGPLDPDKPDKNFFDDKVKVHLPVKLSVPDFTVKLSDSISGVILNQTFDISLINNDGAFDNDDLDMLFNCPIYIKKSTVEKPKLTDFKVIRSGRIETIKKTFESISIRAADKLRSLEEPVCGNISQEIFDNIILAEGEKKEKDAIGKQIPVIYGTVKADLIKLEKNNTECYYIAENISNYGYAG
jgi:hypothetical protein